jgi:hypothetical protein
LTIIKWSKKIKDFYGDFYLLNDTRGRIGVFGYFGIGSPAAVTFMEELIAFGVKNFISSGKSLSLQRISRPSDTSTILS